MTWTPPSVEGLEHLAQTYLADYMRQLPEVLAAAQAAAPDNQWLLYITDPYGPWDVHPPALVRLERLCLDIRLMRSNLEGLRNGTDLGIWPLGSGAFYPPELDDA